MKERYKTTKKQQIYWRILQWIFFLVFSFYLYDSLKNEDWKNKLLFAEFNVLPIVLSFLLIFINQGFEFLKWKATVRLLTSENNVTWKAFFAGISTGFMTPNGWGSFIGKLFYFSKRQGLLIIAATFLANVSQFIPTLLFGILATVLLDFYPLSLAILALLILIGIVLIYLFTEQFTPNRWRKYRYVQHFYRINSRLKAIKNPLLVYSTLRFFVFSLQFLLLFYAFEHVQFWDTLLRIWLVFFITSSIPSLWSGKLFLREAAALLVFSGTAIPKPTIVIVCWLIWLFNQIFPVIISGLLLLPFKKKQ
ncbi:MAG: hypothetical protein KA734_12480 [Fluviicola sp.]|nr:hypothetical protein [Fluviicola sp.]